MNEDTKTIQIEDMISKFGDVEDIHQRSYKPFLFSSLAWSYKFKLARSIIRLIDQNAGMAEAIERNQTMRADAIAKVLTRTEAQVDELENLYNWAATQTKDDLLPANADVINALQSDTETPKDEVTEYAEMMGVTLEEAEEDLATVTNPEVERAEKYSDEALDMLNMRTQGKFGDFTFSDWNALSTMEKIAEKAEAYAYKSKQLWRQTRRKSRKAHLIANVKAFEDIMNEADEYAVSFRNDVEQELQKAGVLDETTHEGAVPQMA